MHPALSLDQDDQVLLEQTKLVIQGATSQFFPAIAAFSILYALALNTHNSLILSLWLLCTFAIIGYSNYLIRRSLRDGLQVTDARRLAYRIVASNILFALHWVSFCGSL